MPTPSRETTRPASSSAAALDDGDTLRFRAPTLEEAIALAESSLGARVRVVAANRIDSRAMASGMPYSRSVTSVMMPSVPSEPTNRRVRS